MIGIDIVDISRIASAVDRFGDRFLHRVFTDEEIAYVEGRKNRYQSLAGRFAAKEAFMKAVGKGLPWKDIRVSETGGRPFIVYRGKRYDGISISHEKAYAVSVVII